MDLDAAADELYGLPPEDFTAARKEHEAAARKDGDRELARAVAGLGKPSTAAWVCNLLVRARPDEVEGLLELGGLLREAQEGLAGDQLRQLDVQRRQLVAALTRQARALAFEQGHRVTEAVATQVEETLRAAMTDPDAGEALRSGRLTSAMSYSGLGTGTRPHLRVVAPRREQRAPAPAREKRAAGGKAGGKAGGSRTENERQAEQRRAEERRRAEDERRQREREEAVRAAQDAAPAADAAEDAARDEERRAGELAGAQEERQRSLDELAAELDRLRQEITRGQAELDRAQRRATSSRRRAADAAAERDRAQGRLDRLLADRTADPEA